jgi:uncharacterized tellurite resistance protein B-like protein
MEMKDKIQICKVVAQAILADCQLTDSEREFLKTLMDKYGLDEDQRKDVMARNVGDDPGELTKDISEFESVNELLVELSMAVAVDGELSSSEKELISNVAAAVGVDQTELDMLVKTALVE